MILQIHGHPAYGGKTGEDYQAFRWSGPDYSANSTKTPHKAASLYPVLTGLNRLEPSYQPENCNGRALALLVSSLDCWQTIHTEARRQKIKLLILNASTDLIKILYNY